MLLYRLVDINGIKRRHIKSGEPHIYHNSYLEIGFFIFKLTVQFLTVLFCAQHVKQFLRIILIPGHNHFDTLNRF